jgi:hypothetical protein
LPAEKDAPRFVFGFCPPQSKKSRARPGKKVFTPAGFHRARAELLPFRPRPLPNLEKKRPKKGNFQKPDYQRTRRPIERTHFKFSLASPHPPALPQSAKRANRVSRGALIKHRFPPPRKHLFHFSRGKNFSQSERKMVLARVRNGFGSSSPAAPKHRGKPTSGINTRRTKKAARSD